MKTRLFGFGIIFALWTATLSGCSSNNSLTPTLPNGLGADQTRGTVRVFLADPGTDDAQAQVRQALTFFGIDDQGEVTFRPVTLDYRSFQTLENVPIETTSIIVQDPDDPSVLATEQVTVLPGQTTYVSDVVLLPTRTSPLVGLIAPKIGDGKPVQVGSGFVQTTPSTIGDPGANNTMAGANATSATDDLPHPYKTNSWLSPILYADNHSKVYAGGGTGPGQYNPSTNPQVLDQRPVYPHPWILGYSVIEPAAFGRPNPPVVPNFPQNRGLKLIAEVPSFGGGPQIPSPDGGNLPDYGRCRPRADPRP